MLKSIWRAFENIWCSYFSCQQGSEALILHFYLYPFFTEFLRALILLVYSSLPSFFHWVADTCPWIEPFSITGWIGLGGIFWHKALALIYVHWYADYPSLIYPPFPPNPFFLIPILDCVTVQLTQVLQICFRITNKCVRPNYPQYITTVTNIQIIEIVYN